MQISHRASPARTALAYCDLCSNRTTNVYCPNRGFRKFRKQSLDEHAARYHKQEVGSHDVRQQLSEEEVRIRTRLLFTLLTVLFLRGSTLRFASCRSLRSSCTASDPRPSRSAGNMSARMRERVPDEPCARSAHLDERADAEVAYDRHHDRRVD